MDVSGVLGAESDAGFGCSGEETVWEFYDRLRQSVYEIVARVERSRSI